MGKRIVIKIATLIPRALQRARNQTQVAGATAPKLSRFIRKCRFTTLHQLRTPHDSPIIARMSEKKRLFLIDGMSNIFRSYYAIRGLSTSRGVPTNAVYGFAMMLRKLLTQHKPDYIGVVLDSKEKTFRHDQYEQYKANRTDMPEDLVPQLALIDRVCAAYRVPIVRLPGFEADDLMGTLAHQAADAGLQAVIVSSDKDLCQLVRDSDIVILREDKTGEMWFDEAGVKARLGVRPDQVVDWLGLMGDASDNIPGAPGIGEKGALALIEQFGSIEGALAGWEEVKKKTYRESLRDNAEIIRLSRELARIETNAPVTLDLASLIAEEPDRAAAYQLFTELEFNQLAREFADAATPVSAARAAAPVSLQYRTIQTVAELKKLANSLLAKDRFAFAFAVGEVAKKEAAQTLFALEDRTPQLVGVAVSTAAGTAEYIDLTAMDDRSAALDLVRDLLDNGLLEKSVHGLKQALAIANSAGLSLEAVSDDTELQAYLLEPERAQYELLQLAREYLGAELTLLEDVAERTSLRADLTGQLANVLAAKIDEAGLRQVYEEIELPLVPLLLQMEQAGFRVDPNALSELAVVMQKEIERLTQQIYELAGKPFNINSPQQLGEVFEGLNFEVSKRTKTGQIQTNREVLEELAEKYELPRLIIEYREVTKLKSTYVDALPSLISPRDGRVHTTLNQTVAATGRLSSENPNLQNIPIRTELGRRIRRAFIPADGCVLLSADYSQIELRLLAHITEDEEMLDAFRKGEDIHARTARKVFGAQTEAELKDKRRVAKIVNFAIAYAVGAFGLAPRVGITRSEAKKVIEDYYATFKGVRRYMEEMPEKVRAANGVVRSLLGRWRKLPDINNKNHNLRTRAEREAINMPMQGTASDIVKLAMLRTDEALRRANLKTQMILQVHDELVFEVPEAELSQAGNVIKHTMETAFQLSVPLLVEVGAGPNWMAAKP
ncbi:MAG TPA: DNA polymerase I [Blastocatellia bacterium]|nr:DNA polymerase I [Blastocatellia bacterium]